MPDRTKFYRLDGAQLTSRGDYGDILQHGMTAHLGMGVYAAAASFVTISDSTISYNSIGAQTYFGTINLTGNTIVGNGVGINGQYGSIVTAGNNSFLSNGSDGTPSSTVSLH